MNEFELSESALAPNSPAGRLSDQPSSGGAERVDQPGPSEFAVNVIDEALHDVTGEWFNTAAAEKLARTLAAEGLLSADGLEDGARR